jgi:hypothetical protein
VSGGGGATWTDVPAVLQDGAALVWGQGLFQAGSYYDPEKGIRQIAVARSTNRGHNWVTTVLAQNSSGYATCLNFRADNPSVGYLSGYYYDSAWYSHGKIFRTTNGGLSWGEIGNSVFDTGKRPVLAIVPDPANPNRLLSGTYNGVYTSTDAGSTWNSPVQSFRAMCITEDKTVAGRFWVGTDNTGVWTTTNSGSSWQQLNTGLPTSNILSIVHDPVSRVLYAGTKGEGVFRLDLPTGVEREPALLYEFALDQNYPNPFNSTSTIGFRIPADDHVKLTVFDLLGREVTVLVDEPKSPGQYQVQMDAGRLASGVYVLRLTSGTRTQTRTLILVR